MITSLTKVPPVLKVAQYLILVVAIAPALGCQSTIAGVYIQGYGQTQYKQVAYKEGLAVDSPHRRQYYLKFREADVNYPSRNSGTLLLYISMPLHPRRIIDVKKAEVFFVWSDISMSVAGFMDAEFLDTPRTTRGEPLLSGDFTSSSLYTNGSAPSKFSLSLDRLPLDEAASIEEADSRGYTEAILESLRTFDIPTEDRDHWLPQNGEAKPEKDEPQGSNP